MARIRIIGEDEAEGLLKEIYEQLTAKRGKLAEVHKLQSLRPRSILRHMELYMEIMFTRSELSRAEREMMAVVVSAVNACHYCMEHHGAALNFYWKDDVRIEKLKKDFSLAGLNEREKALARYARHLTRHPQEHAGQDFTEPLRAHGLSDKGILDATLVVSYFNFVNRMVAALGAELEEEGGEGFVY